MAVGTGFHFYTSKNDWLLVMIPWRNLAEEALNCWLSYTMSQPVQFNLAVLCLFALQYVGIRQITQLVKELVTSFEQSQDLTKVNSSIKHS
jgi:hypothetical protein